MSAEVHGASNRGRTEYSSGRRRQTELSLLTCEALVECNSDIIDRIRLTYGESKSNFEGELLPAIVRYVEFVNVLPASQDQFFCEPGGLARIGLETAFYALQASDSQIFGGRTTITARNELEPRWRQATFLAGLCSELFRAFCDVVVTVHCKDTWSPYITPLTPWARERKSDTCLVSWVETPSPDRLLSMVAARFVIPNAMMSYLTSVDCPIAQQMLASIAGVARFSRRNVLDQLIRRASALVITRDVRDRVGAKGAEASAHWARHAFDALRFLLASNPHWQVNGPKSRIWYGPDGLYVLCNGFADILKVFEQFEFRDFPSTPELLLSILVDANLMEVGPSDSGKWTFTPPATDGPVAVVKVSISEMLLAELTPRPAPLDRPVVSVSGPRPVAAASGQQSDTPGAGPKQTSRPAPLEKVPQQVGASGGPADAVLPSSPEVPQSGCIDFALQAPLQLPADVKAGICAIVATLNEPGALICCTTPHGVFIPLKAITERGLDPDVAVRALSTVGMLVVFRVDRVVITWDLLGRPVDGVVIAPKFVKGLNVNDFAIPN